MNADLLRCTRAKDVSPELLAFLLRPGIGALVDGDDELGDSTQDLEGLGFGGFHAASGPLPSKNNRDADPRYSSPRVAIAN